MNYGEATNSNAYSPSQQNEDLMYTEQQPYLNEGVGMHMTNSDYG